VAILGWIQYEKIKWLQNNNPEVPGLIYKLAPMDEKIRKLNRVHKLWDGIMLMHEVRDVYTGKQIDDKSDGYNHDVWNVYLDDGSKIDVGEPVYPNIKMNGKYILVQTEKVEKY